jgi:hypothetical protein
LARIGSNLVIEHEARLGVGNGCREEKKNEGEGADHSDLNVAYRETEGDAARPGG